MRCSVRSRASRACARSWRGASRGWCTAEATTPARWRCVSARACAVSGALRLEVARFERLGADQVQRREHAFEPGERLDAPVGHCEHAPEDRLFFDARLAVLRNLVGLAHACVPLPLELKGPPTADLM